MCDCGLKPKEDKVPALSQESVDGGAGGVELWADKRDNKQPQFCAGDNIIFEISRTW